ncbi:hypothetical protein T459_09019 [Capsicum annuum]|uniref:Uncharacterized protein n=1 Tax=Capsicum annuum TaxID=4072 RepID=A0A2G2ZY55_CAPAN|nr:hypothetical protein T459_09019 [Capsicum annuum]
MLLLDFYCLILFGGGLATVAPVHDGYVLQKAVATSPIGGEILTDCLIKSLEQKGITIKPRYSFKRKEIRPGEFQTVDVDFPDTTESYKLYCQAINLIASLWALAELWKNLVLLSPSFSYNILDLCLHAISSFLSNSSNSASVAAFATAASSVKALLSF